MARVNSWRNPSPQMPALLSIGFPCNLLLESSFAVLNVLFVILMMGQTHTPNCVRQRIPSPNELVLGASKNLGLFSSQYHTPAHHFFYHNFNDWLGQMLCCPGMEDMMDQNTSPSSCGVMEDIWDAPGVYKILGADGYPFICKHINSEGRYLFSFNMDSFNPFQLKQAGRSASVMGLYMVCLNLPLNVHFKPKNMFLAGIIPGPHEPSMDKINHFLAPLVNDLLYSYTNGVNYTWMWKYPNRRKTRSTLALIICNHLAARQALGFTGPQLANLCSYCKLQLKNLNNLHLSSWEPWTCEEH
jgi:hypothetical protein